MRQGSVIHELNDHGLLVFPGIEVLKAVRPKEGSELLRQVLIECICTWLHRREKFDNYAGNYMDFECLCNPSRAQTCLVSLPRITPPAPVFLSNTFQLA